MVSFWLKSKMMSFWGSYKFVQNPTWLHLYHFEPYSLSIFELSWIFLYEKDKFGRRKRDNLFFFDKWRRWCWRIQRSLSSTLAQNWPFRLPLTQTFQKQRRLENHTHWMWCRSFFDYSDFERGFQLHRSWFPPLDMDGQWNWREEFTHGQSKACHGLSCLTPFGYALWAKLNLV